METIAFHFDPLCPWAWITSRWATRLVELGAVEVEWRLFSLEMINLPEGGAAPDRPTKIGGLALELLAQARRIGGNSGIAQLYTELGVAAHTEHARLDDADVLTRAWSKAGLAEADRRAAEADPTLWQDVLSDHRAAVAACQAFGVPTLILDGGKGPGIFGPKITQVPSDGASLELLEDVVRMTRRGYFFELKRTAEGNPLSVGDSTRASRLNLPDTI